MFTSITYKINYYWAADNPDGLHKKNLFTVLKWPGGVEFYVRSVESFFFDKDKDSAGVTMNFEHYATQFFLATSWSQHGVHNVSTKGGATVHMSNIHLWQLFKKLYLNIWFPVLALSNGLHAHQNCRFFTCSYNGVI